MRLESSLDGNILLLRMTNPPVNCLSLELRRQLLSAFTAASANTRVAAIVLYGAGKYFCAGGDLRELGTAAASTPPRLSADLLPRIEQCAKPVVAAIHGGAVGGGFELALACHGRVAPSDARIALPELKHGIIPLSGSVRLPRLWGIAAAVPMMLESRAMIAGEFRGTAVFDRLVDGGAAGTDPLAAVLPVAIEVARALADGLCSGTLVRNRPFADADPRAALAETLNRCAPPDPTAAQSALIAAVRAGIELDHFDAALAQAQQIYDELARSVSKRT
jgi:enoyl-CoA hydratase